VWRYTHEGFLIVKEPLRMFRIFEHGLQEIFFVANKVHNVVVITLAGGPSFYKETQIGLAQVPHPNKPPCHDGVSVLLELDVFRRVVRGLGLCRLQANP